MPVTARKLAIALHDVEPRTLDRCRLIRQWLADRGADRITLLAIPHADRALEPDGACAEWLRARAAAGDAVAQHGLLHRRQRRAGLVRSWLADRQGGDAAEFVGLTRQETADAVDAGRTLLTAAGLTPNGFVAPAYAYTQALRRALRSRYAWSSGLLGIHAARPLLVPAHGLGTSTDFKRRTSPALLRIGVRLPTKVLRLDVHPADFDLRSHVSALETALRQSHDRRPVTYDELVA